MGQHRVIFAGQLLRAEGGVKRGPYPSGNFLIRYTYFDDVIRINACASADASRSSALLFSGSVIMYKFYRSFHTRTVLM